MLSLTDFIIPSRCRQAHLLPSRDGRVRLPLSLTLAAWTVCLLAACLPPASAQLPSSSAVFDVRTFGATGDGKSLDHPAINQAIEAAHRANGGVVRVPAGTYRCFSIHLQSHVTIHFDPGATILAADPATDGGRYDAAEPCPTDAYQDFGHSHWHNSLFWGENLENVTIAGPGLIHGLGLTKGWAINRPSPAPAPSPPAETRRSDDYYVTKSMIFSALIEAIDLSQLSRLDAESAREEIRDIVQEIISSRTW